MKSSYNYYFTVFLCLVILAACRHEQAPQFSIDLQYSDGTKESHTMLTGSMLYINDGNLQAVLQAVSGTDKDLELKISRYTVSSDSLSGEHTLQLAGTQTQKIATTENAMLDSTTSVQVSLQSVAMIDIDRGPLGPCQAKCCEATCFSTFCCVDPLECKDVPCDCKPTGPCPGQPSGPLASHFFELFRSGKDVMVFKI
jgi:hypothetical protein